MFLREKKSKKLSEWEPGRGQGKGKDMTKLYCMKILKINLLFKNFKIMGDIGRCQKPLACRSLVHFVTDLKFSYTSYDTKWFPEKTCRVIITDINLILKQLQDSFQTHVIVFISFSFLQQCSHQHSKSLPDPQDPLCRGHLLLYFRASTNLFSHTGFTARR